MKAILTKTQVEMLLAGKHLRYGRKDIYISPDAAADEIRTAFRDWLENEKAQLLYDAYIDTNTRAVWFQEKIRCL